MKDVASGGIRVLQDIWSAARKEKSADVGLPVGGLSTLIVNRFLGIDVTELR